jgi:hypothetical protein
MTVDKPPTDVDGLPTARPSTPERWQDSVPELLKGSWFLPVSGAAIYALLRVFYSHFYWKLGLQPEDVGLGYAQILEQSLIALILLMLVGAVSFSVFVLIPDRVFHPLYARRWLVLISVIAIAGLLLVHLQLNVDPHSGPTVSVFIVFIAFVFVGVAYRIQRAMTQVSADRTTDRGPSAWAVIMLSYGLITLILLVLFAMDDIAADVKNGKTAHYALLDQPLLSVGGDPATVYWPATPLPPSPQPPQTPPPYQHCLMYIGQANGSTIFYDAETKTAIRVPSNTIIVQTHPQWRGSNCKPY